MASPYSFDRLAVGDQYTTLRRIAFADVQAFAAVSGDDNPVHVDPTYAAATPYGGPIVHLALIIGVCSRVLGCAFPGPGTVGVSQDTTVLQQVPVDAELTITVTVVEKIERYRQVKLRLDVYSDGVPLVQIVAVCLPPGART